MKENFVISFGSFIYENVEHRKMLEQLQNDMCVFVCALCVFSLWNIRKYISLKIHDIMINI